MTGYNAVDDLDDESDAASTENSWNSANNGDDDDDDVEHNPNTVDDADDDMDLSLDGDPVSEDDPNGGEPSLVVTLRYHPKANGNDISGRDQSQDHPMADIGPSPLNGVVNVSTSDRKGHPKGFLPIEQRSISPLPPVASSGGTLAPQIDS